MRIRVTLDVTDTARRAIARVKPNGKQTARGGRASRELVKSYLQERLNQLSSLAPWWDDEPLRPDELDDASSAVTVLRTAGKSEGDIRRWLLVQRARYDLGKL